jgi:hypothetical protein
MAKKEKEIEIKMEDVLAHSKITGNYVPVLQEVIERKVTVEAAKKGGITVTIPQLQRAADVFRINYNLSKAKDFENWLASLGISIDVFEEHLEENLYISKFKDSLEGKANKAKYLAAPEIKSKIRDLVYQEWLAKNIS